MALFALCSMGAAETVNFHWNARRNLALKTTDRFEQAKLRGADRTALREALIEATGRQEVMDKRVRVIRLTGANAPSVIAQASDLERGCSPVGNCSIWIFKRLGRRYILILEGQGQTFQILPTSAEGFGDILIGQHGSAFETELLIYRMHDGNYRQEECYDAIYPMIGPDRWAKKTTVSRCKREIN